MSAAADLPLDSVSFEFCAIHEEAVDCEASYVQDSSTYECSGTEREADSGAWSPREVGDELARLQAILAGLPQHAVPPKGQQVVRSGAQASEGPAGPQSVEQVRAALQRAVLEYPRCAAALRELVVVHTSLDLLCFADHSARRLFMAARGTDRIMRRATLPRDLGNDALIALGFVPARVRKAAIPYQQVCERFPGYAAYGCGHSLGASVIEGLARWAEADPGNRPLFLRIDLFNPAGSPLRRLVPKSGRPLQQTEVHAHRVPGDFVSRFHVSLGSKHVHPRRPCLSPHALGHFLPEADDAALAARRAVEAVSKAVALRLAKAQVAAKAAVAAIASTAVKRALLAERSMEIAEAAAAADEKGRRPPRGSRRLQLRRYEATVLRKHVRAVCQGDAVRSDRKSALQRRPDHREASAGA